MEALRDITDGAPDGIFSDVFCQVLFAQQAAINTLESQLIKVGNAIYGGERFTRNKDGIVDNGADKTGFMLGADGKLIASNGEFSGLLRATAIHITGNVTAGNTYILKAANYMVKVEPIATGWIDTSIPQVAKQLLTMAKGTATVKLVFPATLGYTSGTKNAGQYAIYVNGSIVVTGSVQNDSRTDDVERTHVINLNGDSNQVWLVLAPQKNSNLEGDFPIYNTIFELRVAQDPGLLAAL
jgi:hypothetical protein